jgi:hypothetical protein
MYYVDSECSSADIRSRQRRKAIEGVVGDPSQGTREPSMMSVS